MNKENTDTTGDLFQAAGVKAPFSMIVDDAEMPDKIDYEDNNNQINLFQEEE